ncbi:MAG: hypothetical protein AAF211_13250, partial [Myxococcota bacterium]
ELDRLRTRVAGLSNPDPGSRVDVAVDLERIELIEEDGAVVDVRSRGRAPWTGDRGALVSGEAFRLVVRNFEDHPLRIAVLENQTNGGVQVLFPRAGRGLDEHPVAPAATDRGPGELPLPVLSADEVPGDVTWKVLATREFVDVRALEYRVDCPGPNERGEPEGNVALLTMLTDRLSSTRGTVPFTVSDPWGTAAYEAVVIER